MYKTDGDICCSGVGVHTQSLETAPVVMLASVLFSEQTVNLQDYGYSGNYFNSRICELVTIGQVLFQQQNL